MGTVLRTTGLVSRAHARSLALAACGVLALAVPQASGQANLVLETIAGGLPNGRPAVQTGMNPAAIAASAHGVFVATRNSTVLQIDRQGLVTVVAGTGEPGAAVPGMLATETPFSDPLALAVAPDGDLLVADGLTFRVYRIDAVTQRVSVAAGNGLRGFTGDGGPASAAGLSHPAAIAVDSAGHLYIASDDVGDYRVRRVHAETGVISTCDGFAGLGRPRAIAVDSAGAVFINSSDPAGINWRIDKVDVTSGTASKIVSSTEPLIGLAIGPTGVLAYTEGHRVVAGPLSAGGTGPGFAGDGGPAGDALLDAPLHLAFDAAGNLFVVDNWRVRRIDAVSHLITTVGGFGNDFPSPMLTAAPLAVGVTLGVVTDLARDQTDNYYFTSSRNGVFKIDAATGGLSTVVASAQRGFGGDGGPASEALVNIPYGVAVDTNGNVFFSDSLNHRVRMVSIATGVVSTVAGNGVAGFSGDGGPAVAASLREPGSVVVDSLGHLFIAGDGRVRRVTLSTGIIETYAGNGSTPHDVGQWGDGLPAASTPIGYPHHLAFDPNGNLIVGGDWVGFSNLVVRVDRVTRLLETLAGPNSYYSTPLGGSARGFGLGQITAMAVDSQGNVYLANDVQHRILRVDAQAGTIDTWIGLLTSGFTPLSPDGTLASAARFKHFGALVFDSTGTPVVAEADKNSHFGANNRIRRLRAVSAPLSTVDTAPTGIPVMVDGETYIAPKTFLWPPGSDHVISVPQFHTTAPGRRQRHTEWSDGGTRQHVVTAGETSATYLASFAEEFQLVVETVGSYAGRVDVVPASDDGYCASPTRIQVTPVPLTGGGRLISWAGQPLEGPRYPVGVLPATYWFDYSPLSDGTTTREITLTYPLRLLADFSCRYTVSPTDFEFGPLGGVGSIAVDTGCTWVGFGGLVYLEGGSGPTFIVGGSPSNSAVLAGPGVARFLVTENTGAARSTRALTVGSRTITVTQEGGSTCAPTFDGQVPLMAAVGGGFSIAVTTACSWTAASGSPWIAVASGAAMTGPGSSNFTVSPNTGPARTGYVHIAGKVLTVSQAAAPCTVDVALTPTYTGCCGDAAVLATRRGTSAKVTITAPSACAWTASSSAEWAVLSGSASGSGNGEMTVTVPRNAGPARFGTLTVGGRDITVAQEPGDSCTYRTVVPIDDVGCEWRTGESRPHNPSRLRCRDLE